MFISNHSTADKALIDSLPGRDLIEFRNSVYHEPYIRAHAALFLDNEWIKMSDLQLFLDARNTVPARLEPARVKEENIDLSTYGCEALTSSSAPAHGPMTSALDIVGNIYPAVPSSTTAITDAGEGDSPSNLLAVVPRTDFTNSSVVIPGAFPAVPPFDEAQWLVQQAQLEALLTSTCNAGNWLPPATPVPYYGNCTSFDENMAVGPHQSESSPFTMPDEQFWGSTMQDLLTSDLFMSTSVAPDFANEFTSASQLPNDSASVSSSLTPPPPQASTAISAPKSRKRGRSEGVDTANIVESARTRTKSAWAQGAASESGEAASRAQKRSKMKSLTYIFSRNIKRAYYIGSLPLIPSVRVNALCAPNETMRGTFAIEMCGNGVMCLALNGRAPAVNSRPNSRPKIRNSRHRSSRRE
ncbi:hypothetical protein C8J57DRAFT_1563084 [Mycena rebaudengoi]|nr:hypothetical protein C8J57DRAFT_1563084 [Mycena rebaudengoi]